MIHATMGSPTVGTFKSAVTKGWLGNLPRITAQMIAKNPPYTMATSLGHLDKKRKNQHSTKTVSSVEKEPCLPGGLVAMARSVEETEPGSGTRSD